MLKKHQLTSGQGDDENRHRSGAVRGSESSQEGQKVQHSQLSISSVQFCSSSGYLRKSIIHAAVVVILQIWSEKQHNTKLLQLSSCLEGLQ